jgi:hypothetical protein
MLSRGVAGWGKMLNKMVKWIIPTGAPQLVRIGSYHLKAVEPAYCGRQRTFRHSTEGPVGTHYSYGEGDNIYIFSTSLSIHNEIQHATNPHHPHRTRNITTPHRVIESRARERYSPVLLRLTSFDQMEGKEGPSHRESIVGPAFNRAFTGGGRSNLLEECLLHG